MPGTSVAVIGAGAWGTTLAVLAARRGHAVRLWFRSAAAAEASASSRRHDAAMPGLALPDEIETTADLGHAVADADVVLLAVPSQAMREVARRVAPVLGGAPVVSASKGIEIGTLHRMSEVIAEELRAHGRRAASPPIAVLSGPNLSAEIAADKPAVTVIAAKDPAVAEQVQALLMSPLFRCYTTTDVVGVELGGALKNIIAIGAGIGAGLDAGENAKAAFITRGIAEMTRLGVAMGADALTFAGIAGLGDLIATCSSVRSRNHMLGRGLASGRAVNDVLAEIGHVAEGISTTVAARQLGERLGIDLPITAQMYAVLFEGKSPFAAIADLMQREARTEMPGPVSGSPEAPPA